MIDNFENLKSAVESLRADQHTLARKSEDLASSIRRFEDEVNHMGEFFAAKLLPDVQAKRKQFEQDQRTLQTAQLQNRQELEKAEKKLREIVLSDFQSDYDEHTRLLDQVQAHAVKMDHRMVEASKLGITLRSHESQEMQFGENLILTQQGYTIQDGAGNRLDRRKRGELIPWASPVT
jgi:predicted metal-dependent hydrolase